MNARQAAARQVVLVDVDGHLCRIVLTDAGVPVTRVDRCGHADKRTGVCLLCGRRADGNLYARESLHLHAIEVALLARWPL